MQLMKYGICKSNRIKKNGLWINLSTYVAKIDIMQPYALLKYMETTNSYIA